jgi:hypothetical protein
MSQTESAMFPAPEHARLEDNVGRWNVQSTYFLGPDQPPMESTGHDTIERVGPFWTLSHFRSELMGAPFVGRAAVGFDPVKKRWVSTWIDSMSPLLFVLEGEFDAAGRVLTMHCEVDAPSGRTRFETREEHVTRDHRVLDMFQLGDGGRRTHVFRFVYRRAK